MSALPVATLTLGPVLFNWPAETWRDFYFRMADEAPVDSVALGEVVCSKRAPFFEPYLAEVIERLQAAGKEVVLSTLALIMSEREADQARSVAAAAADGLLIEANDISVAALLAGRPHAIGPLVNVYNEGTLAYLAANGACRVCLPVELPIESIAALVAVPGVALEVQVFGRLPLAVSARCYHARAHGLAKDQCQYVCGENADGLPLETLDGEPFLAVNGTQTLSYACCNLAAEVPDLRAKGVSRFRLSPQDTDMVAVARVFRDVLDGRADAGEADARLAGLVGTMPFANGFYHGTAGTAFTAGAAWTGPVE